MFKIAISNIALHGKIPAGDARWGQFNDSFDNLELDVMDIANAIYTGRSFTTWHNGRRCIDNFVLGQHIAVDMDSGDKRSSFDLLKRHEFVRMYGNLIYSTPSHTEQAPRSRILFLLDQPITDSIAYQAAAKFICSLFDGCDSACTDASRFFYGSLNCNIELMHQILPLNELRHLYKLHAPKADKQKPLPRTDNRTADRLVEWAVNDASVEGRNKRAFRLGKQLQENGFTYQQALPVMELYQQRVATMKQGDVFDIREALRTLGSAYKAGGMHS